MTREEAFKELRAAGRASHMVAVLHADSAKAQIDADLALSRAAFQYVKAATAEAASPAPGEAPRCPKCFGATVPNDLLEPGRTFWACVDAEDCGGGVWTPRAPAASPGGCLCVVAVPGATPESMAAEGPQHDRRCEKYRAASPGGTAPERCDCPRYIDGTLVTYKVRDGRCVACGKPPSPVAAPRELEEWRLDGQKDAADKGDMLPPPSSPPSEAAPRPEVRGVLLSEDDAREAGLGAAAAPEACPDLPRRSPLPVGAPCSCWQRPFRNDCWCCGAKGMETCGHLVPGRSPGRKP